MANSSPMLSKLVADRQTSARSVLSVFASHGPKAAAGITGRLSPLLRSGEVMPDVALLFELFARDLSGSVDGMVEADRAHSAEQSDDPPVRAARDRAAARLSAVITTTRAALSDRIGQDFGAKLGVSGATPTDAAALVNFAPKFIDAVERLVLLPVAEDDDDLLAFDKVKTLAALRRRLADLVAALGDVARESSELNATQIAKDEKIAAYDESFGMAAPFMEQGLRVAGLSELAATVRPSGRSPGRTASSVASMPMRAARSRSRRDTAATGRSGRSSAGGSLRRPARARLAGGESGVTPVADRCSIGSIDRRPGDRANLRGRIARPTRWEADPPAENREQDRMNAHRLRPGVAPLGLIAAILAGCDADPPDTAVCVDSDCQRPARVGCTTDLGAQTIAATQGTCGGDDGATCGYPDATLNACSPTTGVCLDGECRDFATLCDWQFGPRISILNSLRVGDQDNAINPATGQSTDACCLDFTGDGKVDDKLGNVFRSLRGALIDINPYFAGQIAGGQFNLLFDVRGLDDLVNDDGFQLLVYESLPEDNIPQTDPTTSGHGQFMVKERSWLDGTRIPRLHVDGRVEDGRIIMDQGTWSFFFALPDKDGVVELPFERFRFEGSVALGPDGNGLAIHATMGGLIDEAALLRTLNNEVDFSCDCATWPDEELAIDVASRTCNPPLSNDCDDVFCSAMTDDVLCPTIISAFSPDIDVDGDQVPDKISAGIFIETTSARPSRILKDCTTP
ncbi:MAG: hypothetical protein U1F43_29595 [Myxococcota bacterium]